MSDAHEQLKRNTASRLSRSTLYWMAALSGGHLFDVNSGPGEPSLPAKPCLCCGTPKQHNNSFCSAECCKAYRARAHKANQ